MHDSGKAEALNRQFASVFTIEDKDCIPTLSNNSPWPYPDMPNINISVEGITKLLSNLNPHKASGPDELPTRLLKEMAHQLTLLLTLIFQASLHQGLIPTDWKHALIVPVMIRSATRFSAWSLTVYLLRT